tara:strand:- start:76 stop:240 length:165 start_codon:yes stop_codon:yes gene_type:complete
MPREILEYILGCENKVFNERVRIEDFEGFSKWIWRTYYINDLGDKQTLFVWEEK